MSVVMMRFETSLRPVVLRNIEPCVKVAKLIVEAGAEFELEMGRVAQYAFVRDIPEGAGEGMEVKGIMLILADWVECGQVAVGAGGTEVIDKEMRKWQVKK